MNKYTLAKQKTLSELCIKHEAEIERLKLDADLSEITIARQREEIEQLKSLFKEAADYLDKGHGTSIGGGSIFHQQFREQGS